MNTDRRLIALLISAGSAALGYALLWLVLEGGKLVFGKKRIRLEQPTGFTWTRHGEEADFVVGDPRVSRLHASIDIRSGNYVLEDISSYGTWVRFAGGDNVIALRRQECLLHSDGEIAMGAPEPISAFTSDVFWLQSMSWFC